MKMDAKKDGQLDLNRRDFLKGGSFATLMTLLGGVPLIAETPPEKTEYKTAGPKVKCAVIGLGAWGREIVQTLLRIRETDLVAVCDTYPTFLKRGGNLAPSATQVDDYRKILDNKNIKAVIIATPSHKHREVVIAALQAGKHVYCEAPLAATVEDARAIAQAAKASPKLAFQAGLQMRSDPQRHFVLPFIRSGALGNSVIARAQWHKKTSWRAASPNPEREKELNWRMSKETSPGLIGEIGIHQVDTATWTLNALPVAVTGFGGIMHWKDGRDVADTIQTLFQYPNGVNLIYDCTLASSFLDGDYEMYHGSDATVLMRENKAWMFKEADSPLLGWEVYARKDAFYRGEGIALVANATKLKAQGDKPIEEAPFADTPLHYALEAFLANATEVSAAVEEFTATFGAGDKAALEKYLADVKREPAAGWKEGFEATVTAIKANEAIVKGEKVKFEKSWFEVA